MEGGKDERGWRMLRVVKRSASGRRVRKEKSKEGTVKKEGRIR